MKIGIKSIGYSLGQERRSNYDLKDKFAVGAEFIRDKIGVEAVHLSGESTSDLAVQAINALQAKMPGTRLQDTVSALIVVTQNPDYSIPHTAAIVHGKLGWPEQIACFDISLGCSGFVYALSVAEGLLLRNSWSNVLIVTADPYSKVIDPEDKNTVFLFGDAAAATLVGTDPVWESGHYNFGTIGQQHEHLLVSDHKLHMNGRAIFEFAARYVPRDIGQLLDKHNLNLSDIDLFAMHQGSKYIIDTIAKKIQVDPVKMPFVAAEYGNTVSSSLPILLTDYLENILIQKIVLSGFGVGLSWASTVLTRCK